MKILSQIVLNCMWEWGKIKSATCCGMESRRSLVWNHHEVMYGINPQINAR